MRNNSFPRSYYMAFPVFDDQNVFVFDENKELKVKYESNTNGWRSVLKLVLPKTDFTRKFLFLFFLTNKFLKVQKIWLLNQKFFSELDLIIKSKILFFQWTYRGRSWCILRRFIFRCHSITSLNFRHNFLWRICHSGLFNFPLEFRNVRSKNAPRSATQPDEANIWRTTKDWHRKSNGLVWSHQFIRWWVN